MNEAVGDRIDLRLGPALDTLRSMPAEPAYDLAFIDADYLNYTAYWEVVVPRARSGGAILVDKMPYQARLIDPDDTADTIRAVRELDERIRADDRVEVGGARAPPPWRRASVTSSGRSRAPSRARATGAAERDSRR
ncbi:O-methyltransferase [Streptomyces sp. NBRC 109706]|uniref:O-methyltransferase n=1 Tax=Streptomyces sp. NBRC 109706 TaxID=1550035 RepID=UPI00078422E3|nr:hypothetical protein [Streptomyces sp. NBRC 109706]